MMTFDDLLRVFEELRADDLSGWVAHGWVRPDDTDGALLFTQTDVARVRLIAECHYELAIDAEAMPLVLSLLDQVYGLRRELTLLTQAVDAQPEETRAEILRKATPEVNHKR